MRPVLALLLYFLSVLSASAGELPLPVTDADYRAYNPEQVQLGRMLFYDRVLSGTYRVSCATCHNPDRASSNGFRLDGKLDRVGDTLAINGLPLYDALKPSAEHAPALFNLGAKEFVSLFSDGRVSQDVQGGFITPAGPELPDGLKDVLAVQALFPAANEDELVGRVDNEIADVVHLGKQAIWDAVVQRVRAVEGYLPLFRAAYDDVRSGDDITIADIANAIGAFVGSEWRSDQSSFDAWLRGGADVLEDEQKRGLELFYGKAGCDQCHAGRFQTDHQFHSTGLPVWRFDVAFEDLQSAKIRTGRGSVTGESESRFAYRTPSLRNVVKTAPYGHAGSYQSLEDFLRNHMQPKDAVVDFLGGRQGAGQVVGAELSQIVAGLQAAKNVIPVVLSEPEIADLMAFLTSLTDDDSLVGRLGRPVEVPSGLALD